MKNRYMFFVIERIAEALQMDVIKKRKEKQVYIHSFSSKERRAHAYYQKRGHALTPLKQ